MKSQIPNTLTLLNLCSGCCAILFLLHWSPEKAAICVFVSFVADFLDGLTARWLGVSGPLGKELDSLADVVSFGVVPATMLYMMAATSLTPPDVWQTDVVTTALPIFVLAAFSALRLAKFNLDTRQTKDFIGLATPANTLLILGLCLSYAHNTFGIGHQLGNLWFILGLTAVLSYLLVCEIPMFGFKSLSLRWAGNQIRLTFVALSVGLIIGFRELGLAAAIVLYIAINSFLYFTRKSSV